MNCARRAAATTFAAYLDGAGGWLFSDECDDAKPEEMESWWDDVRLRTEEMLCAAYYAAEHEYAMEKDREMEKGARAAAAKRAAAEGGGAQMARAAMRKITTHNGCRKNAGWRL